MFKKFIFIAAFCSVCILSGSAQVIHKPADLMKIMKASKLSYKVEDMYIDMDIKDYSKVLTESNTYHEDSDGHMIVKKLVLSKDAETDWALAEKAFTVDSDFKAAKKLYKSVFDLQNDYYPAKIRLGQIYEKEGDFEKAVSSYKQAISKNYIDFISHWHLAEAYHKAKNYDEAAGEITLASILNRNNNEILERLNEIYADANITYSDWVFSPQVKIFKSQKENEIKVLCKQDWNGYAIGKAIWDYEPGYAEGQGEKPGNNSLMEEKECLLNLIAGQDTSDITLRHKDPGIAGLLKAQENKMIESFIYYEEFLRSKPSMVYELPNNVIKKMRNYVLIAHAGLSPRKK